MTLPPFMPDNCPVREHTADGRSVGRCWFYCPDGTCPRHGDVREAMQLYRETGKLTNDTEVPR
jgi:Pyruvate/2-oxoacid:ferredoxin oxidoreductase delta subunit